MRRLAVRIAILGLVVAACGRAGPNTDVTPGSDAARVATVVPRCSEIVEVSAPAELYRDSPIYVANEMPVEAVRVWAEGKPGFEEIWIDRDHLGWITVAFSQDAQVRQAELEAEFPEVGVVAVAVDWTMAELHDLQRRVGEELSPLFDHSSWISVTQGVAGIDPGVLKEDRVSAVNELFAGERVCIEGIDPADAPAEGSQPSDGSGWRLLADASGAGYAYRTGIATDAESYQALWTAIGLSGDVPDVDFSSEVVIWFGAVFGSSCPDLRLDGVVFDTAAGLVYAEIVLVDPPAACTADANPHAYVVAVDRARLPTGPFAIQLDADGPPPGAPEERTLVEVDLSEPGAVAHGDHIRTDPALPEHFVLESGSIIEPDIEYPFRLNVHCGIEWLGRFNSFSWRTDVPEGSLDYVAPEWRGAVTDDTIEVSVILETSPEPKITATANGHAVIFRPTIDKAPGCD